MMQASPPIKSLTSPPSSIYEAIKNDDWEGLLSLYATTVYDAVHAAEFAQIVCGEEGGKDSAPSSLLLPRLHQGSSDDGSGSRSVLGFFLDGEFDLWFVKTNGDNVASRHGSGSVAIINATQFLLHLFPSRCREEIREIRVASRLCIVSNAKIQPHTIPVIYTRT